MSNSTILQSGYFVLAGILILVGIAGAIVPILPGVPLIFAGMLLAAWADGFHHIGAFTLVALGVLATLALLVDFVAGVLGAKRVGASERALWGASIGMLVGFFFSLPGLLLGPFLGALIGEWSTGRKLDHAARVGIGTWIGMLFGTLAKLALCFTMLGVFALAFLLA